MSEHNGQSGAPGEPALTPVSGAALRAVREQGVLQELPSGIVVRMRPVKPAHLLRLGKIPDVLTPLVLKVLYGQAQQRDFNDFLSLREQRDEALAVVESVRVVCTAALVEPRIVDDPQADDEIHIDDLDAADQAWIFNLAFLEAKELRSFRRGQAPDVEPMAAHEEHAQPPV